jgi:hypothetical protein
MPTLVAAAGEPDVKQKLLKGHKAGNKTFKNHLDGYNFLPFFKGQEEKSPRREIFYFDDNANLNAIRIDDWKISFKIMQGNIAMGTLIQPNMPLVINLRQAFEKEVVHDFIEEYLRGRTPNPCVACNQHIKFGLLLDKALFLGADYLATGHYAKVEHSSDGHRLLKAADTSRDQSYFLYTLTPEKLGRILFPLGEHSRDEVKHMAKQAGLPAFFSPCRQMDQVV